MPGKIISIHEGKAIIDYGSERREAIAKGSNAKEGDYVLVQFGIVSEIINEKEAKKAIECFSQI